MTPAVSHLLRIAAPCILFMATAPLLASSHRDFQTGKLLDITSDERLFEGTTVKHAVYVVQPGGVVYSARGERVRRHSGDPGHGLIIGDSVPVSVDGDDLILQRPDGKEIKAKIIKRQRTDAK